MLVLNTFQHIECSSLGTLNILAVTKMYLIRTWLKKYSTKADSTKMKCDVLFPKE